MSNRNRYAFVLAVAASILCAAPCFGAEIRVWSGGATREVMNVLAPEFKRQTGHKVRFNYMVIRALPQKLAAGERGDMAIASLPDLDGFIKGGKLKPKPRAVLGSVGVALVVRQGAPLPDISTPEKFRQVLLDARSVVHPSPKDTPSGADMVEVFQQLGITEAMQRKIVHRNVVDGGAELVAKGKVDFGLFPASAMKPIKGVTVAGLLPRPLQRETVFAAGIMADNAAPEPAMAFLKFVTDPANRKHWKEAGFEPPLPN